MISEAAKRGPPDHAHNRCGRLTGMSSPPQPAPAAGGDSANAPRRTCCARLFGAAWSRSWPSLPGTPAGRTCAAPCAREPELERVKERTHTARC